MQVISLQSGSNGNCIYVEAGGVRLLFDAGISGRQAELRLAARGRDIAAVDAVLISHDHRDHVRCAGVFQRKFGLPVYATRRTIEAASAYCDLGVMTNVQYFEAGGRLLFGEVVVETIPTPHDGADGVAFVVDDGYRRLGILTDLGHVFDRLTFRRPDPGCGRAGEQLRSRHARPRVVPGVAETAHPRAARTSLEHRVGRTAESRRRRPLAMGLPGPSFGREQHASTRT